MRSLTAQPLRNLPVGLRVAVWLAVFLSPTVYALLAANLSRSQVPAPPGWLIVGLFGLIPVVALRQTRIEDGGWRMEN
jgi:hypothetical protein